MQFVVLTLVVSSPGSCTLLGNRGLLHREAAASFGIVPSVLHGDKCRKRTGLLKGWIDSRDRHRFAKHCSTTKGGSCSFLAFEAFFALPTPAQCPTYPVLFVDALAFVLSTSAREQPSSSLIRESGLGDVVYGAVCSRSLELHDRR